MRTPSKLEYVNRVFVFHEADNRDTVRQLADRQCNIRVYSVFTICDNKPGLIRKNMFIRLTRIKVGINNVYTLGLQSQRDGLVGLYHDIWSLS